MWLVVAQILTFATLGAFWVVARGRTRRAVGFGLSWPAAAGHPNDASGWGSVEINGRQLGTAGSGPVCLYRCDRGYVLHLQPVFGGGYILLPGDELQVRPLPPHGLFRRRAARLRTRTHDVVVYGHLAQFVLGAEAPGHDPS
jgi:hypothetical protein